MTQWEYKITFSNLPQPQLSGADKSFSCDHQGQCVVHDSVVEGGIAQMESLFGKEGDSGWELVQFEYHEHQLLCVWKRPKP